MAALPSPEEKDDSNQSTKLSAAFSPRFLAAVLCANKPQQDTSDETDEETEEDADDESEEEQDQQQQQMKRRRMLEEMAEMDAPNAASLAL
eukprot:COSAG03_NODE_24_length_19454_cov_271.127667_4_plen_91_part_00